MQDSMTPKDPWPPAALAEQLEKCPPRGQAPRLTTVQAEHRLKRPMAWALWYGATATGSPTCLSRGHGFPSQLPQGHSLHSSRQWVKYSGLCLPIKEIQTALQAPGCSLVQPWLLSAFVEETTRQETFLRVFFKTFAVLPFK